MARCVNGTRAKSRLVRSPNRRSIFGTTQMGVRWYTVRSAAVLASSGMSWTAVAPVPMTAMRHPVGSKPSSQSVVWMTLPSKLLMPGMSGTFGWDRKPVAVIR